MSKHPITLEQVVHISGLKTQFSTHPRISNRVLLMFFRDIRQIIKELDPELNYEGKLFINLFPNPGSVLSRLQRLWRYSSISQSFQFRRGDPEEFDINNVVRTHNIDYRHEPHKFSEEYKRMLKDNLYRDIAMLEPNIEIVSTHPIYDPHDLVSRVDELPYVALSERYDGYIFNPEEIMDVMKNPDKFVTSTGRVLRVVRDEDTQ